MNEMKNVATWAAQLRYALVRRNSVQQRLSDAVENIVATGTINNESTIQLLDDIRNTNEEIVELMKALQSAPAEYLANALMAVMSEL